MRWILVAAAMIVAIAPAGAQRAPNGRPYLSQPLVSSIFTADPAAHVFDGRIYVYASHDVKGRHSPTSRPSRRARATAFA